MISSLLLSVFVLTLRLFIILEFLRFHWLHRSRLDEWLERVRLMKRLGFHIHGLVYLSHMIAKLLLPFSHGFSHRWLLLVEHHCFGIIFVDVVACIHLLSRFVHLHHVGSHEILDQRHRTFHHYHLRSWLRDDVVMKSRALLCPLDVDDLATFQR